MAEKYLDKLQTYMDQIDTRTYHDFKIDKIYLYVDCIFTGWNEIIITCSALFERQYLKMRKHLLPCVKIQYIDMFWIYWGLLHSFLTCILRMNYIT